MVPLMYGLIAEKENFIDRIEDRKQLVTWGLAPCDLSL